MGRLAGGARGLALIGPEGSRGWAESTRLIHAATDPLSDRDTPPATVNPPVQRGSTVLMPNAASLYSAPVTYGRLGLGTQMALREALSELEGAHASFLLPSGAAAISAALTAVLDAGDELLAVDSVYAPTRRFCGGVLRRFGVATRYFHPRASAEEILALAGPRTRAILLESPGSLTFEIQDTPAIAAAAAARGLLTLIDNTWAAGVLFKPLAHGVDLSIQSLTKYVGGHADVFMGSIAVATPLLARRVGALVRDMGWSVSPDDAYTILRGLRTLSVRLAHHGASGLEVAQWLQVQPEITSVLHPGLPSSPDHALWSRDFTGACGLFGATLTPARPAAVHALLDRLALFGLGFSWGGFESLALHCDPQLKRTVRQSAHVGPLIRLHVGLEGAPDLIRDLRQGLDAFAAVA